MRGTFAGHELRVPRLSPAEASAIAAEHFGVRGEAVELGSQQDQNFRLGDFVLKVANPAFARAELDLQNRAMEHVAARLPGVVPVPVRGTGGDEIVRVAGHDVRLVTWLDGAELHAFGHLAGVVLRAAGGLIGRVTAALGDFAHPAADRVLQWDSRRAGEVVAAFAPWVADAARRALLERPMERAARALAPLEADLPLQVIHGDPNDLNLVAHRGEDGRPVPTGLLDFGDTCRSWRAAECAVLAVSVAARRPDRLVQDATEAVRGFHAALPLSEPEVDALPALMAARAALCAAGCEQQAVLDPDKPYAVVGAADAWRDLAAVAAMPDPVARTAFRAACGLPAPRRAPVQRGAPLVPGVDLRRARVMDLSTRTDDLAPGAWRDPAAIAAAVGDEVAIGRHGEGRIVHDRGASLAEPATVHLGVDVFLPAGTRVHAPVPGRVVGHGPREVVLAVEDGLLLRLAGVTPAGDAAGRELAAGDAVGEVVPAGPVARLPAHVHVQLADSGVEAPPGLVPASLAAAWRAACPDPGPLLGVAPAAAGDEPTAAVLARRRRAVASPQRLYFPDAPPRIERGWRQWLYDVGGRPYLDLVNNVAVLGHSHPAVEAAAARQLRHLNTNSRFLYDVLGRFAEQLAGLLPDPLEVVFCVNSGSEAVDLALRLARDGTGRRDLLCIAGAYHGWTGATDETMKAPPWVHPIDPPHLDPERSLAQVQAAVARRPPAAFVCEPLLGNWGGVLLPDGWLAAAFALVRAAGGLCIADEVQVGYGRPGRHFWAFEQQGVVPDLVTIAKPAGNGHPLGAVICTRALADEHDAREDLFSSPGGGPVSCAIGLAVLDAIEREGLQENARRTGDHLTARLGMLVDRFEPVTALHGMGLYQGLGLSSSPVAFALCERLLELGVLVQPTGPELDVLKIKPPLCITTDDVDLFAEALEVALGEGW